MDLPCREDDPYCAMVEELVNLPTAQQRYDYMMSHYSAEGYDVTLEGMMLHYAFSGLNHTPVNVICICDFPSVAPEYMPGALDVHEADCPWRFDNLSKAEQFTVIGQMTPEEKAPYLSLLTAEELENLQATMMLVDDQLIHVGTGEVYAYLDADGVLTHAVLNVPFAQVVDGTIQPLTAEPEVDPAA